MGQLIGHYGTVLSSQMLQQDVDGPHSTITKTRPLCLDDSNDLSRTSSTDLLTHFERWGIMFPSEDRFTLEIFQLPRFSVLVVSSSSQIASSTSIVHVTIINHQFWSIPSCDSHSSSQRHAAELPGVVVMLRLINRV